MSGDIITEIIVNIAMIIMSAYFLEQCQENVDNDYLYVFPNAGDGVYRIYE